MNYYILFLSFSILKSVYERTDSYFSANEHGDSTGCLSFVEEQPSFFMASHYLLDVHHVLHPSADPVSHTSISK